MEPTERLKHRGGSSLSVPSGRESPTVLRRLSSMNGKSKGTSSFPSSSQISTRTSGCSPILVLLVVFAASMLASAATYRYYTTVVLEQHDAELHQQIRKQEIGPLSQELRGRVETLKNEKEALEQELATIQKSRTAERAQLEHELYAVQDEIKRLHQDEEGPKTEIQHLQDTKKHLQKAIQIMAKQRTLEKYGPGPHKVEIEFAYAPQSNIADQDPDTRHYILLELAPIDLMPYTTYWFLEQVSRGLYDGTSVHRNAGHVIQAGPVGNFLSSPKEYNYRKPFKDAELDGVWFQEYSPDFPHKKYTVGYAGRPGGPDWYISMMDNTKNHGPGGQGNYADASEADPCFAKVIKGMDVADRIHQSAVQPGSYKRMEHYVAVVSMRIL